MKIIKFLTVTFALLMICGATQAQFSRRLNNAVKNAAENAAVRQAEKRTENAVNKAIDDAFDNSNNNANANNNSNANNNTSQPATNTPSNADNANTGEAPAPAATPPDAVKATEMTYAKSDFVSGDEIIFEDNQTGEQIGEFPSQWDLIEGNVEIAKINGENAICLAKTSRINPLMKDPKDYLPESYTIEMDFYIYPANRIDDKLKGPYSLTLRNQKNQDIINVWFYGYPSSDNATTHLINIDAKSNGENRAIKDDAPVFKGDWNRLSISFNKRALKVYFNGQRVANAPNIDQANWFLITGNYTYGGGQTQHYIKNIRVAKGAVPLYDRMLSDGKFITYGITFDVGKSTIKPESMGEINRIVTLMTENPELKFSVEGHTDSTGNEATNQTLSEARSQAVVDKLVENGIARDRLTAAGKGQAAPIADNATDEGRAKNRRVEFVKT